MTRSLVVDAEQLKRLLKFCRAITGKKGMTVRQLQTKLKTSRRTVFRDLNALQEFGVQVELGESGYILRQSPAACRKLLDDYYRNALDKLLDSALR